MPEPGASVVRWVPATGGWRGFRPEPFVHERLWTCPLLDVPSPDAEGFVIEAGFDAQDRPVTLRVTAPGRPPYLVGVTVYGDGETRTFDGERLETTTTLDDAGRPVQAVYANGQRKEYVYDDRGRLVTIHEYRDLWIVASAGERTWTGGTLSVEYDELGPARIIGGHDEPSGIPVWERVDEPWEATLSRGADEIAAGIVATVEQTCRDEAVPAATEVFALALVYVDQGGLRPMLSFGLKADRRRWLASGMSGFDLACALWYPIGNAGHPLNEIDEEPFSADLDTLLLREAALKQPDGPARAVLTAAAQRLARHDWTGVLAPTDDFVVFIAEHDEDFGPKHRSVREVNPPERVTVWDARWPAEAQRD